MLGKVIEIVKLSRECWHGSKSVRVGMIKWTIMVIIGQVDVWDCDWGYPPEAPPFREPLGPSSC